MKVKQGCRMKCSKCGEWFRDDGKDCIIAWNESWCGDGVKRPMALLHTSWSKKGCDDETKYPLWQHFSHMERKVRTKWNGMQKKELIKLSRNIKEEK